MRGIEEHYVRGGGATMDKQIQEQKIDYKAEAEKYLERYRPLLAHIRNLEEEIRLLEEELKEKELDMTRATTYDEVKTSETNKISDPMKLVDKELDRIYRLKQKLRMERYLLEKIERAIDSLRNGEKRVIRLYYLNEERFTWEEVAQRCGYSEQHCKQYIKEKALEAIAIAIFGLEAAS